MSVFAVVDTNVLLSALLSKKNDTATVKILCAMMNGKFTPLWHDEIIAEYDEVFHREKISSSRNVNSKGHSDNKNIWQICFYGDDGRR